jgi:hypothetical protein
MYGYKQSQYYIIKRTYVLHLYTLEDLHLFSFQTPILKYNFYLYLNTNPADILRRPFKTSLILIVVVI